MEDFHRSIRSFDALTRAKTFVLTDEGQVQYGERPPLLDVSGLHWREGSHFSGLGEKSVLTTHLRGQRSSRGMLVSVFDDDAKSIDQESLLCLHESIALMATERASVARELDEMRRMFQSVLDTIPVRVFWKDRNCIYQGCNRLFARDAGFDQPEEMIGKTDFDTGWPEQAELYQSDDTQVMGTGTEKVNYEEPQTHPGGKRAWLQTSKIPLRDQTGEITGVLGTYADITPRKEAEEQREELLGDLESKNAELERFTYTVSHDLKSPLVTINGFLGVLEEDIGTLEKSDDEVRESMVDSISRIKRAAGKMGQLLEELLEMSRVGRHLRPQEPTPLRALLDDSLLLCDGALKNSKAKLTIEGDFPTVHVDGSRIVQVLQNLIDNACKYRSEERDLELRIRCDASGKLLISDNGIGISPRHHERIFRVFEKLNPETEGSGIGLALVKRIVETHNGSIEVQELNPGTAFHITLPLAEAKN